MAESTVLELKQNEIGDRKQRNSNLELMRILLMLGMIAHHYVVNSGVEALYDLSAFFLGCLVSADFRNVRQKPASTVLPF